MIGDLPETLNVGEKDYPIRSDYRNVLQIFEMFKDMELEQGEKWIVAIYLLFEDFTCADDVEEAVKNGFCVNEAAERIMWYISAGSEDKKEKPYSTYDWVKDEQMIFSAVNKVANKEVRDAEYMHWWTFIGYFNEIGEGTFTFIVNIRDKLNKGKKLEKNERDFLNQNRDIVILEKPKTKEEIKEEAELKSLIDDVIG